MLGLKQYRLSDCCDCVVEEFFGIVDSADCAKKWIEAWLRHYGYSSKFIIVDYQPFWEDIVKYDNDGIMVFEVFEIVS